jgi:hypothetical protein
MGKKEYTEESAVKKLQQNRIKVENKTIVYKGVGLKLLGAVDFLVNNCKYKKKVD